MADFDLIVIGSGPGGQRAAIQAAKLKKKVAIVEANKLGGSCLHLGTIPSKSLREAALSTSREDPDAISKANWIAMNVIAAEEEVIRDQLTRNHVEIIEGWATFKDAHTLTIRTKSGDKILTGDSFVLATGNRPRRPEGLKFEPPLYESDTILQMMDKPRRLAVMGAGVIGCEYASIFAQLGVEVSLYDRRNALLRDLDGEILDALKGAFSRSGIQLRLGEETSVTVRGSQALIKTDKDEKAFDAVLYCQGRLANVEELNLGAVGLKLNDRGVVAVNKNYQTEVSHIYAVGDVQGMPGLATSAAEQGRMASASLFDHFSGELPSSFPYGVYTIPEISSVGPSEEILQEKKIPYIVGRARYKELARGKIMGDEVGLLKLMIHKETQKLLSVHAIGTQATELIHIGQVAMALGADLKFLVGNVFNYPTFAEAYKVAAFQAFNKLNAS